MSANDASKELMPLSKQGKVLEEWDRRKRELLDMAQRMQDEEGITLNIPPQFLHRQRAAKEFTLMMWLHICESKKIIMNVKRDPDSTKYKVSLESFRQFDLLLENRRHFNRLGYITTPLDGEATERKLWGYCGFDYAVICQQNLLRFTFKPELYQRVRQPLNSARLMMTPRISPLETAQTDGGALSFESLHNAAKVLLTVADAEEKAKDDQPPPQKEEGQGDGIGPASAEDEEDAGPAHAEDGSPAAPIIVEVEDDEAPFPPRPAGSAVMAAPSSYATSVMMTVVPPKAVEAEKEKDDDDEDEATLRIRTERAIQRTLMLQEQAKAATNKREHLSVLKQHLLRNEEAQRALEKSESDLAAILKNVPPQYAALNPMSLKRAIEAIQNDTRQKRLKALSKAETRQKLEGLKKALESNRSAAQTLEQEAALNKALHNSIKALEDATTMK